MTSHPIASIKRQSLSCATASSARNGITVAPASPSANTHVAMAAYDEACEHLRSDILRASKLFPDTTPTRF
jgi:hypothetical protein